MKVITTGDGSNSIYVEELEEQYHSVHGAINEANHVFIRHGLEFMSGKKSRLNILELGFGTGLNTLLTRLNSRIFIDYVSLEKFPISPDIIKKLNYEALVDDSKGIFSLIHSLDWELKSLLNQDFWLTKNKIGLEEFITNQKFDLIYYDAFAPRVQPELWTKDIFAKCFKLLNKGGCLVTYCAKGQVKRDLKTVGFTVEQLPGPPGKREMTRALKM